MRRANYYTALHAALARMRRRNPTGYAQLMLLPFGPIPAYAEDDPKHEWWSSDEARTRLDSYREGAAMPTDAELDRSKAALAVRRTLEADPAQENLANRLVNRLLN